MPLKRGKSNKVVSMNIHELMHGKKHAEGKMTLSQALAISLKKKRESSK